MRQTVGGQLSSQSGATAVSGRCQCPVKPRRQRCVDLRAQAKEVTLLDYGAGNVRSVRNAITRLGYAIKDVRNRSISLHTLPSVAVVLVPNNSHPQPTPLSN